MLPHETCVSTNRGMADAVKVDADTSSTSPHLSQDDEIIKDARDDVISAITNANDVGVATPTSKKRVQFLPDGCLVRVREIPPRSNKSSSESDGSASDTTSDSSDTDTDSDSEDQTSDRDTPSPAQNESATKFTTMPPLVWTPSAAKGPYTVKKSPAKVSSQTVAKITGIQRPSSPAHTVKQAPKRSRRTPSPKQEKRHKKPVRSAEKNSGKTNSEDSRKFRLPKRRVPLKKEGKVSPPLHPKSSIKTTIMSSKGGTSLAPRRAGSAPTSKVTLSKRAAVSTVSTSLIVLPSSSFTPQPSVESVGHAMQSLTVGQLYTVDGFIFPSHHATQLHLPEVIQGQRLLDNGQTISNGRRSSTDNVSPRRNYGDGALATADSSSHIGEVSLSPTSANRKKRHYAWHMANGSPQNTLQNTPSIAQLWDTPHESPGHTELFKRNGHNGHRKA